MKQQGFNLIELCVCMSIIIILSGGFYYGYQHHRHEFERKQAELYLQDIALNLQEHQDQKTGYASLNLSKLGFIDNKDDYAYQLNVSSNSFLIQAQPQFQDNCGMLSLNQTGTRSSFGDVTECWK